MSASQEARGTPSFLGLFEDPATRRFADGERARTLVLPVPYEATTSYLAGTAAGPAAILAASAQVELYDEVLGAEIHRTGIHTLPPLDVTGTAAEVIARIQSCVAGLAADRFVLALGGEHTVTVGAARAVRVRQPGVGFLVIDAHDDLRDRYHGSPLNHACVSRRLSELGPVVQVGIRSVSPDGAAGVPGVLTVPAHEVRSGALPLGAILEALPERVYVSIDIDGLDPACCPGVGTPEPGGLDWYQVTDLIAAVAEARRIVAADLVEVRPLPHETRTEFLAAKLLARTIGLVARSAQWPALD